MNQILIGDCLAILPTLPRASVQCCVTSPPYWGLRDYGTATWEGGEEGCEHKPPIKNRNGRDRSGLTGSLEYVACQEPMYKDVCRCGARRIDAQLGLEPTPEEFITKMVAVFREVKRVLRDDGTLWVNMGDSYSSDIKGSGGIGKSTLVGTPNNGNGQIFVARKVYSGLKPKDLCMMPARLAMALQADGWYLRSDIIWAKPNPMPESVTDRPTKSHEYIFLLSKQANYFYDAESIKEPSIYVGDIKTSNGADGMPGTTGRTRSGFARGVTVPEMRNRRSVWTVATQPYAEAHFATFPEDLIKPCIMAGSRLGDTVLDPFLGSGTTARVALELGRSAIGIELNPAYAELARNRTNVTVGML
jgi:DNA modification methylase